MFGAADLRLVTERSLVNTNRLYEAHAHAALVADSEHAVTYCAVVEKAERPGPPLDRPLVDTFNESLE